MAFTPRRERGRGGGGGRGGCQDFTLGTNHGKKQKKKKKKTPSKAVCCRPPNTAVAPGKNHDLQDNTGIVSCESLLAEDMRVEQGVTFLWRKAKETLMSDRSRKKLELFGTSKTV